MIRKSLKKTILFILILCLVGFSYFYFEPKSESVPYVTFTEKLAEKQIETATISEDVITFSLRSDSKKIYSVPNPNAVDMQERLLISGAEVKTTKKFSEIISLLFDILFYVIFACVFIFAFKKFISPNTFKIVRKTGVTFDDVIGMDELKKAMLQIADLMKHSNQYKNRGMRMPKGILMEGAPGNGKTLFARALANEAGVNFIPAKATDFESMFMAIGPAKVKLLFKKARRNAPCIVFIDEFDGIGTKRNYSGSAIETENTRIVTALLNELDGFTVNDGVLVIAATNTRAALDEALVRPGRFDAKFTVPYPDSEARLKLIQKYSKGKDFSESVDLNTLVKKFEGFSAAHIESVLNSAALNASQENKTAIDMNHIAKAIKEL